MNQYIDIMLDLETLETNSSPALLEISAVNFNRDTGKIGSRFSTLIKPQSCIRAGLDIDGETVKWWLTQDQEAIERVLIAAINEGKELKNALLSFSNWISLLREKVQEVNPDLKVKLRVWGNGIIADNVWLQSAYEVTGLEFPIRHNEHRDVRTVLDMAEHILGYDLKESVEFTGLKHVSLDDCIHQIKQVSKAYMEIRKLKG